jgi:hypothetical protein
MHHQKQKRVAALKKLLRLVQAALNSCFLTAALKWAQRAAPSQKMKVQAVAVQMQCFDATKVPQ